MKKVLSLVLALVMALSLCTSAWATGESEGTGTGETGGAENVAEVTVDDTTKEYTNIDEALTAWAASGGTLKVLKDCTATSKVQVLKNAVLDLNGKVLMLESQIEAGKYDTAIELAVKDTSANGKLVANSSCYFALSLAFTSKLTIENATIEGQKSGAVTGSGTFVINNSKLQGPSYGLSVSGSGVANINSGEVNTLQVSNSGNVTLGEINGDYDSVKINKLSISNNSVVVNFNSGIVGTFSTTYVPTLNTTDNAYFESAFTKGLPAGKFLESVEKDGKTYYQVKELSAENAAAKVIAADKTETLYADASVAAANLKAGGTLQLLKNHDGDTLRVNPGAGSVTVDLNGKTVTNTNGPALYVNINGDPNATEPYTVTVKNGTLVSTKQVALRVSSTNNVANVVTESVTMTSAAGNAPLDLQNSARLVVTDEAMARGLLGNGYIVTLDGVNYGYGINGGFVYAVKALPAAGGTVKLLDNYTGTQKLSYTDETGKPVVLDLNKKTYNYTYKDGIAALEFARQNSKLTVTNGTIVSAAAYGVYGVLTDGYPTSSANDLTLTLDGVTVKATNGSGFGINGVLTGNVTTIKNSTIIAADTGIYYPAVGTLNIENSTINGEKLGVALKGGTTTISGDKTKISANAAEKAPTEYYTGSSEDKRGITAEGYALYVEGGYNDRDIALNVNGGSFDSKGDAVKKFVKDGEETAELKRELTVTGGAFSNDVKGYVAADLTTANITTSGETTYYVGKETVEAAAAKAPSGSTVTVTQGDAELKNVPSGVTVKNTNTGNVTVNGGTKVTKDNENGYTVPRSYYYYPSTPGITAELNGTNKSATDYPGGDYGLVFRSTAAFSTFQGVQVDGKTLAKSNYTAEEGSTVVYLKAAYLKTLAAGKHTITILSTAGNTSMDFTIGGKSSSPKTFDAGVGIYAVTAVLSVTGMAWTAKKRH